MRSSRLSLEAVSRGNIEPIPPEVCELYALQLDIVHAEDKSTRQWVPTNEQKKHWDAVFNFRFTYTLKARQVFITTAQLLYDLLFVVENTRRGHFVEVWLVWDEQENSEAKLQEIANFAEQLGFEHRHLESSSKIEFPRYDEHGNLCSKPSVIRAKTAGSKQVGRGGSAHLVHGSEVPYWRDPASTFRAFGPGAKSGRIHLETTMAASVRHVRRLWDANNEFTPGKVFLSVEDHEEYRMDPRDCRSEEARRSAPNAKIPLPDSVEEFLRKEGFTNRRTMAFVYWAYLNLCGEDWIETLREYPQTPKHCFNLASGRWIPVIPRLLPHREHKTARGNIIKVFFEPHEGSGRYIIGDDTAGKSGITRHAVAAIDHETGRLMASWVSSKDEMTTIPDNVDVAWEMMQLYTSRERLQRWGENGEMIKNRPPIAVEVNGPGNATAQLLEEMGADVIKYDAEAGDNEIGLLAVRQLAKEGLLAGPDELVEESNSLAREQKNDNSAAKFTGLKDLCMALSAALVHRHKNPAYKLEPDIPEPDTDHFHLPEGFFEDDNDGWY